MTTVLQTSGERISALPQVSLLSLTDMFPLAQGNVTYKASLEQILERIYQLNICDLSTVSNLNATYNNGTGGIGATLINAGALATLVIDGVTVVAGMRILVKDQTDSKQNGIYSVINIGSPLVAWELKRSTDYDSVSEIEAGDFFTIALGVVNSKTQYIQTQNITTIGIDSIIFESNIIALTGLTKTNNNISTNTYSKYVSTAIVTVENVANGSLISPSYVGSNVILANTLKVGSLINIKVKGIYSTTAAPGNFTLSILLNATTNLTTNAFAITASVSNLLWEIDCFLTVQSIGSLGTIISQGAFQDQINISLQFSRQMINTIPISIDTTINQTIGINAAWSAPAVGRKISATNTLISIINA